MNKTQFIATLHAINAELHIAIADADFDLVRLINERRQRLLHKLVSDEASKGDVELLECLEGFSSEVADNIKQVEEQFSSFARRASGRLKVLDGYRF